MFASLSLTWNSCFSFQKQTLLGVPKSWRMLLLNDKVARVNAN